MGTVKTLKIKRLAILTTKPTTTLRKLEKVLRECAGKDWTYDFDIEA